MRVWPLHLLFGALLVGSLTAQQRTADTLVEIAPKDLSAAVTRIAQAHGWSLRDHQTVYGNVSALRFDASGCSEPVIVALRVNFDFAPFVQSSVGEQVRVAALCLYQPVLGAAQPPGVFYLPDEICRTRDIRPDALRAGRAFDAGRGAIRLPIRRDDRLGQCLEPRLRRRRSRRRRSGRCGDDQIK